MNHWKSVVIRACAVALCLMPAIVFAQAPPELPAVQTACGRVIPPPAKEPPNESPPVVYQLVPCFEKQGGVPLIDPETYVYYIHTKTSRPSQDEWVIYDESIRESLLEDFRRLWATAFLDDLSIEVRDYQFSNGVVGKLIFYNMEERQRVKIVDYVGSKAVETSKIDERLKEVNAEIRLDTFIDASLIRKAEGVVRDLLREKGFQFANVTHQIQEISGGPKLVHLTFTLDEGPKVKIRRIMFAGNQAFKASTLKRQFQKTKERPWWQRWLPSFLTDTTYQEGAFDEDAERLSAFYRDHGYITAVVGTPELKPLGSSPDGKTRWLELRIPVTEGRRYRVGTFTFEGNAVLKEEALRPFFKLPADGYYSEDSIRKGLEKLREVYGAGGYFEFTGFPDLKPLDRVAAADAVPPPALASTQTSSAGPPIVDVTMRLNEGRQFFVNRIGIIGNTFTRDNVVRRELALVEGGVLNTEALKNSVRRLNQLGYFKPIENQKGVTVEKTPGTDSKVDVTLKVEEQNRNQVSFGAGVSEIEGIFGTFSFTTANFFGRGESVTVMAQQGSRAKVYQIALTEPYLFDRPTSGSIDLYSRKYDYYTSAAKVGYSEVRQGSTVSVGKPLRPFLRFFMNYTYETVDVSISDDLFSTTTGSAVSTGLPLFSAADKGRHVDSRIAPTLVYNTVDNPMMPHSGVRLTGSMQMAGGLFGGSYSYLKPDAEAILYVPTSRRTGFGFRAQGGWLHTYGRTTTAPYYLKYFLGGEYQIRGVDIRTVGPLDSQNRALGGNRAVLFNAEYYVDVGGSVRLLAFHDAGQAFADRDTFTLKALRTSSGFEGRVIVPMLNVPFRFIYYWNVYRDTFQPPQGFKFAVGTTF